MDQYDGVVFCVYFYCWVQLVECVVGLVVVYVCVQFYYFEVVFFDVEFQFCCIVFWVLVWVVCEVVDEVVGVFLCEFGDVCYVVVNVVVVVVIVVVIVGVVGWWLDEFYVDVVWFVVDDVWVVYYFQQVFVGEWFVGMVLCFVDEVGWVQVCIDDYVMFWNWERGVCVRW